MELRIGAAYIRVSTDDQIEYSPDSQLAEIRKYAKSNGILVPDDLVFIDEGISGRTTDKRPEFQRMIGTAKLSPRPFDMLLLWKFSRFARNREDSIVYKSMLRRELGIDVVSVSEPIGDDKMAILIEALIEAMDEYYSLNLAQEVKRGMTQRAKEGKYNTYAPIGYKIEDGQYVPDPDTAPLVRKVYANFMGGKPLLQITRELNDLGARTRFGNIFEYRHLRYILRNPVYTGKVHWTPTGRTHNVWDNPDTLIVNSEHDPLIDQSTFDDVQAKLDSQKVQYGAHARRDGILFMLKGLVYCSCCGTRLSRTSAARSSKGEPGLQCLNYQKGKCPESHHIVIYKLSAAVLKQIDHDFSTMNLVAVTPPEPRIAATSTPDNAMIVCQIAREKQKLQRAREAYENAIYSLDEYVEAKKRITSQIEKLEAQHTQATPTMNAAAFAGVDRRHLATLHDSASIEESKNDVLSSFVAKIIFDRKNNQFSIKYRI